VVWNNIGCDAEQGAYGHSQDWKAVEATLRSRPACYGRAVPAVDLPSLMK